MDVYNCNSLVMALLMLMDVMSTTSSVLAADWNTCQGDLSEATKLCLKEKLPPTSECCDAVEKAGASCVCDHGKTMKSADKFSAKCIAFNVVWRSVHAYKCITNIKT